MITSFWSISFKLEAGPVKVTVAVRLMTPSAVIRRVTEPLEMLAVRPGVRPDTVMERSTVTLCWASMISIFAVGFCPGTKEIPYGRLKVSGASVKAAPLPVRSIGTGETEEIFSIASLWPQMRTFSAEMPLN